MTTQKNKTAVPLIVLTTLFFMWGFITCMNDILVPYLKKMFELNRFESMFIIFSFFIAYFIGSLVYYFFSLRNGDPIMKYGYKNGIITGLLISALATALFYPAAEMGSFALFLIALFVLGLGFTLLQIAANPYVAIIGPPETASSRLNLSQAFNSFGTTIAPIIGGFLVFHYFAKIGTPLLNSMSEPILMENGETITKAAVQIPYLIFSGIFLLLILLVKLTKLPRIENTETLERSLGALQYRHLVLGMVAIFLYVGAEVSIGSVFINFSNEIVGFTELTAKSFLAFYWGGAMIGRFLGAISLSSMSENRKNISMFVMAILTFLLIFVIVYFESNYQVGFAELWPFLIFLLLNFIAFKIGKSLPGRTLAIFAFINVVLLLVVIFSQGMYSLWPLIGIGLFNSIMWSNIFTLAIKDLGKYTSQASSLLVMMILGGALLPLLQGKVADLLHGYHQSFFIPIISYIYLTYYGWKGHVFKLYKK